MFDRYRLPPAAALMLGFLSVLLPVTRVSVAAAAKPHDFGTATVGSSAPAAVARPDATTAGPGTSAASSLAKPGLAPVAGASATAQVVTLPVCTAPFDQTSASMVADGSGGGVVVWQDMRVGTWDVYAQRVGAGGATQWG